MDRVCRDVDRIGTVLSVLGRMIVVILLGQHCLRGNRTMRQ
ncbi:MAG TPA: hypothetical protein VF503_28615 [Sphingobium sp.]